MLYIKLPSGRYSVAEPSTVHAESAAILFENMKRGPALSAPSESVAFLKASLSGEPAEVFAAIFLDNRHRVLEFRKLFFGTIDNTTVYPREVVRQAMELNAAAVILAHNHPSGVATPSDADRLITRRLKDALELIDVRVLDHIVVAGDNSASLASHGLL